MSRKISPGGMAMIFQRWSHIGSSIGSAINEYEKMSWGRFWYCEHVRQCRGAIAQLRRVSQREEVKYVTIRGDDLPSQKTTRAWLAQLGFPNSDSVVFCRSVFQKIAQVMREPGEHVIIDDRDVQRVEALHEVEGKREMILVPSG